MKEKEAQLLTRWSEQHYSDLPWRKQRSLYGTLVSEIMLQQTTVGTVLNHFDRFLTLYPTIQKLSKSSEEEVCIAWKGLGYYRRARSLRNLAIEIVNKYNGEIPTDLESLLALKGIGPYTANAIVGIGADKRALAVDANLERVLARYYGFKEEKGLKLQKKIWSDFDQRKILKKLDNIGSRKLNEALMDLGRVVCQARQTSCSLCPLNNGCQAFANKEQMLIPFQTINEKEKKDYYLKLLRVLVFHENKVLMYKKNENEWLAGQWELPTFQIESNDEDLDQYPKVKSKNEYKNLITFKSGITKYKITNYIYEINFKIFLKISEKVKRKYEFKNIDPNLNMTTTSHKILKMHDGKSKKV